MQMKVKQYNKINKSKIAKQNTKKLKQQQKINMIKWKSKQTRIKLNSKADITDIAYQSKHIIKMAKPKQI